MKIFAESSTSQKKCCRGPLVARGPGFGPPCSRLTIFTRLTNVLKYLKKVVKFSIILLIVNIECLKAEAMILFLSTVNKTEHQRSRYITEISLLFTSRTSFFYCEEKKFYETGIS